MFFDSIVKALGSSVLTNLILIITFFVAFFVGYRQIWINDVVELYATPQTKEIRDANGVQTFVPIVSVQNTGTRLVYMDKYVFNGSEYITHGQVLPPTYAQSNALYYIDLPRNEIDHVSIVVYYHDLDSRYWKSELIADKTNGIWKIKSLPRLAQ